MPRNDAAERVLAAVRSDSRIAKEFRPTRLEVDGRGTATVEAEVPNAAVNRLALERIAATPGISGIVDRLRVKPASAMSDDGIRDRLRKALIQDPALQRVRVAERVMGEERPVRDVPTGAVGEIVDEADEGVVTLNGTVPSLAAKRLAGVLAWWVPGSRDVINGLAIDPPEADAPIRLEEAVRICLDKDPFVDASQIRVGVRNRTVRLTGQVPSDANRDMAEWDAWYVFGVDHVVNEVSVRP